MSATFSVAHAHNPKTGQTGSKPDWLIRFFGWAVDQRTSKRLAESPSPPTLPPRGRDSARRVSPRGSEFRVSETNRNTIMKATKPNPANPYYKDALRYTGWGGSDPNSKLRITPSVTTLYPPSPPPPPPPLLTRGINSIIHRSSEQTAMMIANWEPSEAYFTTRHGWLSAVPFTLELLHWSQLSRIRDIRFQIHESILHQFGWIPNIPRPWKRGAHVLDMSRKMCLHQKSVADTKCPDTKFSLSISDSYSFLNHRKLFRIHQN